IGGVRLESFAAAASPIRAILIAVHPNRDTQAIFAAADAWFVVVALTMAALLNGLAILRLRVWNPGREMMPRVEGESEEATAPHDKASAEAARAIHVDARVRTVDEKSRQVGDNAVLWRGVCMWACGRQVFVINGVS